MADRKGISHGIDPAIMGMLQHLPPAGTPWPEREQWKAAFRAVIEVVYPASRTRRLGVTSRSSSARGRGLTDG